MMVSRKELLDALEPERVQRVEEMSETIRDLHTSAVTLWGPAPARLISSPAMLTLNLLLRVEQMDQEMNLLRARVERLEGVLSATSNLPQEEVEPDVPATGS